MEKYLELLQSNRAFVKEGVLYSVSEKNHLLTGIEISSGKVRVLNKNPLRNRLDYICVIDETIYMVDISAKWIAETNIREGEIVYFEMSIPQRVVENFALIDLFETKILMFLRYEPIIYIFDTIKKQFYTEELNIKLCGNNIESVCRVGKEAVIFSSGMGKTIRYDLCKHMIVDSKELLLEDTVMYSLSSEDKIYVLSGDSLYDVSDCNSLVMTLENGAKSSKMCKCGDIFWFFPGKGDEIYKYDLAKRQLFRYVDYPDGYASNRLEGWNRFVGKAEDEKYVYWCMRTNNRIMQIDRETGKEKWLKPILENEEEFYSIVLNINGNILNEELCDLDIFLSIVKSDM